MTPQQITSPFSFTGYTPDVPARVDPSAACKENDRILANLQTGQLQQLLLLQQQQQLELHQRSPAPGAKWKLVVSGTSGVPSAPDHDSAPASATNSPARSALAGSRKKQQHAPQLGWQESPNPYLHLISPSDAQRGASPARAPLTTPQPQPLNLGDNRPHASSVRAQGRSVLMSPAAGTEAHTPRRRAQGSMGRRGKPVAQGAPTTPAAEQSLMLGAPAPNPFSFAAQKRPERVMYD
jgi:hypothetical protein